MVTTRKRRASLEAEPTKNNSDATLTSPSPRPTAEPSKRRLMGRQSKTGRPKPSTSPNLTSPTSLSSYPSNNMEERMDPKSRGIHPDAIQVGRAPSRAATCVACHKRIEKRSARWGIKYAGNPLPVPVIPLYGRNPMVLWCHPGGCGLSYVRYSDLPKDIPAARTCHACQDAPDDDDDSDSDSRSIRLLCGGPPNPGGKIRSHAFHISCWRNAAIGNGSEDNDEDKFALATELYVSPLLIGSKTFKKNDTGNVSAVPELVWTDLTDFEQQQVLEEYTKPLSVNK